MKLFVIAFWFFGLAAGELITIQVYYESFCPYSQAFLTQQLYTTYQKLGKYMRVDLKPYGNAAVSNSFPIEIKRVDLKKWFENNIESQCAALDPYPDWKL